MIRADGQPAEGLRLLDRHAARFPGGALAEEARVARVEALLTLGRNPDALAILDGFGLEPTGSERELLSARAALRAGARRCGEALADFARLEAGDRHDEAVERALYGRAFCHAQLGDEGRARAALEAYLKRFPGGAFAATARRALAGAP